MPFNSSLVTTREFGGRTYSTKKLEPCSRCCGQMLPEKDIGGRVDMVCLQCGFRRDAVPMSPLPLEEALPGKRRLRRTPYRNHRPL